MSIDAPLISCLMVTRQRLQMAQRAIDCYASQDYASRELVIVSDGHEDAVELEAYATARCGEAPKIKIVGQGTLPLGALRNAAIGLAAGEIVCQWDDDDYSHPQRLSRQLTQMQEEGADACFLTDQLQLVVRTRSLYWCDWTRPRGVALLWPTIPNTLFCRTAVAGRYPESGPVSRRSEDAYFMRSLLKRVKVAHLGGCGWLYVYVSHGANTWPETHHVDIIRTTALEKQALIDGREALAAGLSLYALGELSVRDFEGREIYRVRTGHA